MKIKQKVLQQRFEYDVPIGQISWQMHDAMGSNLLTLKCFNKKLLAECLVVIGWF